VGKSQHVELASRWTWRWTWALRAAWLALPLTVAPALGDAVAEVSRPVGLVAAIAAWAGWVVALVATFVPRSTSLTVVRIAAPAVAVVAIASASRGASAAAVVAVAWSVLLCAIALAPATGEAFVDGSSYGDEQRFPLRVPTALVLGPIPLAWCIVVAGIAAGPLLLAARAWIAGALALAVGAPLAAVAARRLHVLSRRWVVLVPAGLVLHDPLALAEPQLFTRAVLGALGPALAGSTATDLTMGALGLPLELALREPVDLAVLRPRIGAEQVVIERVLFAPTRPGAVLAAAATRRLPVATPAP
jgi:hypothetical protein